MSRTEPIPLPSLRHVALLVYRFDQCLDFYTRVVGYSCEWQPDADNVYLSCGDDNLALHRAEGGKTSAESALDHIGFFLAERAQVDTLHRWLLHHGTQMEDAPRLHRDGAYSFYCRDPDGNRLQFICHPPVARQMTARYRQAPTSVETVNEGETVGEGENPTDQSESVA